MLPVVQILVMLTARQVVSTLAKADVLEPVVAVAEVLAAEAVGVLSAKSLSRKGGPEIWASLITFGGVRMNSLKERTVSLTLTQSCNL